MSWGIEAGAADTIAQALTARGVAVAAIEADLADITAPAAIYDGAVARSVVISNRPIGVTQLFTA